jgi:RHS repeat-associated protein
VMLLRAVRDREARRKQARLTARARARRTRRAGRRLVAAALGPVLAASTGLVPVAVTAGLAAGLTAASVAVSKAPAKAATLGSVLILLQNGESAAPESADVPAGYTVTQVTPSAWEGMTAAQFAAYSALVIGDPSSGSCSSLTPTTAASGTDALGTAWQAAVTGNVAVLGTSPALPGTPGADGLISDAIGYAAAGYSSSAGAGTGLYVSLNCEYSTVAAGTDVSLLDGVEGIGTAGGLTVQGGLACSDTGTVNTWEADSSQVFAGLPGSALAGGAWPSPACPVQEAFDSWPATFTPVAYDAGSDVTSNFTASDGAAGQPYVVLGAPVTAATQALAPSAGGEVPAGSTAGGGTNAAAPGVRQALRADPVNTENGDFTQSDTDFSVPGFGPSLDFTRTYDAGVAQQEAQTGTPGPLGYGWTDDWASSLTAASPVAGDIYTVDGLRANTGQGGPAAQAAAGSPAAVSVNGSDTYFADPAGNRIEEIAGANETEWGITMTAGDLYTVAGSPAGASGASGNGKAAGQSLLNDPTGVFVNSTGMYISDTGNCRVVEIPSSATSTQWGGNIGSMTASDLYVIAGRTGDCTIGLDAKGATSSDLWSPAGLHFGQGTGSSDLYIADAGNNRIQEIAGAAETEWGQSMTAGDVYTVAGSPAGTAGDTGDGGAADSALLDDPQGITTTGSNDLFIADTQNCRVQQVPNESGAQWGITPAFTSGDIYTVAGRTGSSGNCTIGDDGKAATASNLIFPAGVAYNNSLGLFIADTGNNRIQEVARTTQTEYGQSMTQGFVYTLAGSSGGASGDSGNGGAALSALLDAPGAVALDGSNDLVAADTGNNQVRDVSSSTEKISDAAGDGYTAASAGNGGAATAAGLNIPQAEAFDAGGDVFIADGNSNRVEEIAASSHKQFGITMTAGDVYTVAGSATGVQGISGDGGKATSALLYDPQAVAISAAGNLYIDDGGNSRIQEVSGSTANISTVAGSATGVTGTSGDGGKATSATLLVPESIALDAKGDLYIADTFNNRIQEVYAAGGQAWGNTGWTAGDIYTIAGSSAGTAGSSGNKGPASSALLSHPSGLATDAAGNLYIADFTNDRVAEIAVATGKQRGVKLTADDLYVIAGSAAAGPGLTGDGGPATTGLLDEPTSVAADPAGDVYIGDSVNNRVQEVPAASGTQWSQSMSAGDVYTVAGSAGGAKGNSGDGGPATSALMSDPQAVSLDPDGDVYITDLNNNRLREMTATTDTTVSPAPGQTSSLAIYPSGTAPGGITITQPGGAQVTFYGHNSGGSCTSPYVAAGQYCTLPEDTGATLIESSDGLTYAFSPSPGSDTYTYSWDNGQLVSETDTAGDTLTIGYQTPAPGSGSCPSAAATCETITAASGRALVIGSNGSGLITSVTDPMGREWTYAYNSADDLTAATDPMGNVTTYTYDSGNTNPMLADDLLTVTSPNAQPGGPDAGDSTVNVYDSLGRVTTQTDPMGYVTTFNYCVNAANGDCMDEETGSGYVTVADPDGNTTVYNYDQGTLAAQSSFTGTALTSEQDYVPDTAAGTASGGTLLDAATFDGNRNEATYQYDSSGNVTSATAPGGNDQPTTTTSAYTSLQQDSCDGSALASSQCSATDAGPATVSAGGVITPPSSTPPLGMTYSLYDNHGNELYATAGVYQPGASNASYEQTTYQLFKGNSVTIRGANVSCTSSPPSPSLPCASINADGAVAQLAYDSAGDLISSSTADGNGSELATTTYSYDGDGEQDSAVSPDGNLTGANAGNFTTTTAWSADSQKTSVTQGGGAGATVTARVTSYAYDADGNQAKVTDARIHTTTTSYNADDQATLVTDPDDNAALTCYDGDGNTTQTVPPIGVAASNLTAASCPASYPSGYTDRLAADGTASTFNVLGKVTQRTTPSPAGQSGYETTSYGYDADGNVITTSGPPASNSGSRQITTDTYNAAGLLASQTTGSGTAASTATYCYDPNHDVTSVVYANGNASAVAVCEISSPWVISSQNYPAQAGYQTIYSYNSAGELVSTATPATSAAPSGAITTATYDPAGNMLTSTDPDGITTTLTYTPQNLTASVAYSGSSAHQVSYTYDANDNKTAMSDATGTSGFLFDPFGELASATNGAGQTTSYSYDADGDTTGITYPLPPEANWATSDTVSYGYDDADLLTSVTDFNGRQITLGNTSDGITDSEALGSTGDTITTSYDNTDNPSAVVLKNSSSTLQSFTYSDAPAGGILSEADAPASSESPASYSYDAQGRVTSMTLGDNSTANYGFDSSSNLTTLPNGAIGTYDNAGELTSSTLSGTTTSYTYNAVGEQLAAKQGNATVASGTWNGAGQLTAYSTAAADMSAATFDGNGIRASSASTKPGGSTVAQDYVWNTVPQVPQLIMDSTNAYIYGSGYTPAEQVNLSTGALTYLVTDFLGSVRGIVNGSGALTGTTSYDAWGNPATAGGLTATTPFGYTGGYADPDGLIYLLGRYYDPEIGQFISVDPDLSQTLEPYEYADANPVSNTDPTGTNWRYKGYNEYWATPWLNFPEEVNEQVREWIHQLISWVLKISLFSFEISDTKYRLLVADYYYRWYTAGGRATRYWAGMTYGYLYLKGDWKVSLIGFTLKKGTWGPWWAVEEYYGTTYYES